MELKEIEQRKDNVEKRMHIAQKKIDILVKKLEECKDKNVSLPPSVCDTGPLNDARKELRLCKVALVQLAHAQQIMSFKKGDVITTFTTSGYKKDRDTGFKMLDFELAYNKANEREWFAQNLYIAELEIVETKHDGRVLAKSIHHPKQSFLGISFHAKTSEWIDSQNETFESDSIIFYRLV